jgi:hypothetical protein
MLFFGFDVQTVFSSILYKNLVACITFAVEEWVFTQISTISTESAIAMINYCTPSTLMIA